jgi:hypothetical protein
MHLSAYPSTQHSKFTNINTRTESAHISNPTHTAPRRLTLQTLTAANLNALANLVPTGGVVNSITVTSTSITQDQLSALLQNVQVVLGQLRIVNLPNTVTAINAPALWTAGSIWLSGCRQVQTLQMTALTSVNGTYVSFKSPL